MIRLREPQTVNGRSWPEGRQKMPTIGHSSRKIKVSGTLANSVAPETRGKTPSAPTPLPTVEMGRYDEKINLRVEQQQQPRQAGHCADPFVQRFKPSTRHYLIPFPVGMQAVPSQFVPVGNQGIVVVS